MLFTFKPDANIDRMWEIKDTNISKSCTVAPLLESAEIMAWLGFTMWKPIGNSIFGWNRRSPACCWLSRAGEVGFLPILAGEDGCRHVVSSAKSLTSVYASPAKPVLAGVWALPSRPAPAGVLPAPRAAHQKRLFADIGRGKRVPPCCTIDRLISRRVSVAGVAGSHRRVTGPTSWQSRLSADMDKKRRDAAMFYRQPFHKLVCKRPPAKPALVSV